MKRRGKILLLALLALGLLYLHSQYHITTEQLLSWQPENLLLAAFVLLCFFAVKSVLVFVPIMIPQILVGHLYPRDLAILINLLGLVVVMAVPYWPLIMHWHEDFVALTPAIGIMLLLSPFVLPACTFAGYLQGPRLWAQTEVAMKEGRRRAKAKARVGKKLAPRQQKPEI